MSAGILYFVFMQIMSPGFKSLDFTCFRYPFFIHSNFDELASLGPDFLKDIIDNKYSDSTSKYSTVVISKISRIDELCDLLCLDLN